MDSRSRKAPPGAKEGDDTVLATSVIERIGELAVQEVVGVHDVVSTKLPPPMTGLARDVYARLREGRGVKAIMEDETVRIEVRVVVEYGRDITLLAERIREVTKARVEELAGISVSSVTVNVVGIHASEDDAGPETE